MNWSDQKKRKRDKNSFKTKSKKQTPFFVFSILCPPFFCKLGCVCGVSVSVCVCVWVCVRGDVCLAPSGCHQDRDLSPATKPTNEGTRFTAWAAPIASTTSFISPLLCGYNLLHYFFPPPLSFEFHTVYTRSHSHARTCSHTHAFSYTRSHIAQFYEAQKTIFYLSNKHRLWVLYLNSSFTKKFQREKRREREKCLQQKKELQVGLLFFNWKNFITC